MVRIVIQRTARPETASAEEAGRPYLPPAFAPTQLDERTLPLTDPARYQPQQPRRRRRWPRRPLVPRWAKWAALAVLAGLFFRRAVAWAVLAALSAALHLFGVNVNLPHLRFGWPWQSISAGTATNTLVGPLVLQKIEGISRPALGTENFNFVFTHTVSKRHRAVAVLVLRDVRRGRARVRDRQPQPGPRVVEAVHRPLPAARAAGGRARHPGPAGRLDGAAAASAAAVGA